MFSIDVMSCYRVLHVRDVIISLFQQLYENQKMTDLSSLLISCFQKNSLDHCLKSKILGIITRHLCTQSKSQTSRKLYARLLSYLNNSRILTTQTYVFCYFSFMEFNYVQDLQATCKGNYYDAYSLDENDPCYKSIVKVDRVRHSYRKSIHGFLFFFSSL